MKITRTSNSNDWKWLREEWDLRYFPNHKTLHSTNIIARDMLEQYGVHTQAESVIRGKRTFTVVDADKFMIAKLSRNVK